MLQEEVCQKGRKMIRKLSLFVALVGAGSLLSSCSSSSDTTTDTPAPPTTSTTTSATSSGSLADPKSSIAYQLDLIKAGDADKLKTCLTPRVQDSVTQEVVDKAKTEAGKYTMDDLYASAEMGEDAGKKTAKVKMKNGRTLTTLIETDGKWLADTVWFK